jgi:cytochrome P450
VCMSSGLLLSSGLPLTLCRANRSIREEFGFGKNPTRFRIIDTLLISFDQVEGTDWQRHRKVTAPPFSDRKSGFVWNESLRQAQQMLTYWTEKGPAGVKSVTSDMMTLGLHVLTCAGFGIPYRFCSALEGAKEGYSLNYRDCLAAVLENLPLLALASKAANYLPFLPGQLTKHRVAVEEFKRYMVEMVEAEKCRALQSTDGDGNLLSSMVRNSQTAQRGFSSADSADGSYKRGQETSRRAGGLTDSEIYGNIFMFHLAGHESTANTLAYSIYLFAAFPEWQEWVIEEIDHVLAGQEDFNTLDYESLFPQLRRCLAVMVSS